MAKKFNKHKIISKHQASCDHCQLISGVSFYSLSKMLNELVKLPVECSICSSCHFHLQKIDRIITEIRKFRYQHLKRISDEIYDILYMSCHPSKLGIQVLSSILNLLKGKKILYRNKIMTFINIKPNELRDMHSSFYLSFFKNLKMSTRETKESVEKTKKPKFYELVSSSSSSSSSEDEDEDE